MARAVSNHISQRIHRIREQEYERGWSDAKAKRAKALGGFYRTLYERP
jgi:hypothetical protein